MINQHVILHFFLSRGVGWRGFGVGECCGHPEQRSPRTIKRHKNEYSKLKKTFFFLPSTIFKLRSTTGNTISNWNSFKVHNFLWGSHCYYSSQVYKNELSCCVVRHTTWLGNWNSVHFVSKKIIVYWCVIQRFTCETSSLHITKLGKEIVRKL